MSEVVHSQTALEDRIGLPQRLSYSAGAFVNNLLAAASGGMIIVLNLGFGMSMEMAGFKNLVDALNAMDLDEDMMDDDGDEDEMDEEMDEAEEG